MKVFDHPARLLFKDLVVDVGTPQDQIVKKTDVSFECLFALDGDNVLVTNSDKHLFSHNLSTGNTRPVLEKLVWQVDWMPKERPLTVWTKVDSEREDSYTWGPQRGVEKLVVSIDKSFIVINLYGETLHNIPYPRVSSSDELMYSFSVPKFVALPDDQIIMQEGYDKSWFLYSIKTGEFNHLWDANTFVLLPNGNFAGIYRKIALWNPEKKRKERSFVSFLEEDANILFFDEKVVYTTEETDDTVAYVTVTNLNGEKEYDYITDYLAVGMAAQDSKLAVGMTAQGIRIWDTHKKRLIKEISYATPGSLVFLRDGRLLIAGDTVFNFLDDSQTDIDRKRGPRHGFIEEMPNSVVKTRKMRKLLRKSLLGDTYTDIVLSFFGGVPPQLVQEDFLRKVLRMPDEVADIIFNF